MEATANQSIPMERKIPYWRTIVLGSLAGAVVWLCLQNSDLNNSTEAGVVMDLPTRVGDFVGKPGEITEAERTILPADTEFARKIYENPTGNQIMCSIVLSGGEKRSIHRPEICLPGQGWTVTSGEVIPIRLNNGRSLDVMKLNLSRDAQIGPGKKITIRSFYLYWFVGNDRSTPSHLDRVLLSSWDRVFHKINHRWAYNIVTATVTDNFKAGGKNAEETLEMLKDFVAEAVPEFQKSEMQPKESKPSASAALSQNGKVLEPASENRVPSTWIELD